VPALLGTSRRPLHEAVVHHSLNGKFAIRQGKWKLILCPGSGGYQDKPAPDAPPVQLYDMEADVSETRNLQGDKPEVVRKLRELLENYIRKGRSTPGPEQTNDVPVTV
jgi:hypothetical protein